MDELIRAAALDYHRYPRPGKISVTPTKVLSNQRDLSLAYSPGVAAACDAIVEDPAQAAELTARSNLIGVVTNGTAVLGLGNIGPLAAKPVMEGKAVLFKQFAGIDVYDIEVNAKTPQDFIKVVEAIAPTFGGINLEDIAAPHCFEIEAALKKKLDIPVFHDDQHGTAVIICAGLINALHVQGKSLETAKIVCLGAGAAGIASMNLLVAMGAKKSNILLVDSKGVVHKERSDLNSFKKAYARKTRLRTLDEAMCGADAFVGVSGADLVSPAMVKSMAERPVVFALANPNPEIAPEKAKAARGDLVMATGRSDYPNQVNNVLGFPFIFRGALDARAKEITQAMLVAAVHALAGLAREPVPAAVLKAYKLKKLSFGPDYILPKPFDPRLAERVPQAVAKAAKTPLAKTAGATPKKAKSPAKRR